MMLHGGDTYGLGPVVDFSVNLNPLGMPPQVARVLREQIDAFDAYPDLQCRELVAAISAFEGVPKEWIVPTAGGSDLFVRIALALEPRRACIVQPEFSGYTHSLGLVGCAVGQTMEGADIRFMSRPNNPTGTLTSMDEVRERLEECERLGAYLVLDEAFIDFTDAESAVCLCAEHPKLIIARSMTKMYSIAGLRLGYGICSDTDLVARLWACGAEWAVSTPAQLAGIAALACEDWPQRTREFVAAQRQVLKAGLAACGMERISGEANFLLFHSPVELYEPLLERGFMIRTCESFEGLGEGWYRVAVRSEHDNAALLEALRDVVGR